MALPFASGIGQPHDHVRRLGAHQAEAAAPLLIFCTDVIELSTAADEVPQAGYLVRASAAQLRV